jgi:Putative addiction module component
MTNTVIQLLEEAIRLPLESQTELIEALLERAEPSQDFLDHQLGIVARRMQSVRDGSSNVVSAEDAHNRVLASLRLRA